MDPVTLIALAGTALVAVTIAITWDGILRWFRSRSRIMRSYSQAVAFTIAERINGKEYTEIPGVIGRSADPTVIVQGIYDPDDGRVVDARMMRPAEPVTDKQVIAAHDKGKGLVIYQLSGHPPGPCPCPGASGLGTFTCITPSPSVSDGTFPEMIIF